MTSDIRKALAWGFGLGVGFAAASLVLGLARKL